MFSMPQLTKFSSSKGENLSTQIRDHIEVSRASVCGNGVDMAIGFKINQKGTELGDQRHMRNHNLQVNVFSTFKT